MKNNIYLFFIICTAFLQFNCSSAPQESVAIKIIEVESFLFPIDKTGEDKHLKIIDDSVYIFTQKLDSFITVGVYIDSLSLDSLRKLEVFYDKKNRTRASITYYDDLKRPNGLWRTWHPNGQLHRIIKYNHGQEVGYMYEMNEKGILTHFRNYDSTGYFPNMTYLWSDDNHLMSIGTFVNDSLEGFLYRYNEEVDSSYFSHNNIDLAYDKKGRISEEELRKIFDVEVTQLPRFYYSMNGLDATK
jgi:antitoxin component YwqK of YwqJK toxin-antitoxin module